MARKNPPAKGTDDTLYTQREGEYIAVFLVFFSLFIFVSNHFPDTTGIVGKIVVQFLGQSLFGKGILYLPAFLLLTAFSLVFAKARRNLTLVTTLFGFIALTIFLELKINHEPIKFSWPLPLNAGGIIGYIGLWISNFLIGPFGTHILLITILTLCILIFFNLSIRKTLKFIGNAIFVEAEEKPIPKKRALPVEKKHWYSWLKKEKPPVEKNEEDEEDKDEEPEKQKPQVMFHPEDIEEDIAQIEINPPTIQTPLSFKRPQKQTEYHSNLPYKFPPLSLLTKPGQIFKNSKASIDKHQENAKILEDTLASFNVAAKVVNITPGPSITRYELAPGIGVKISKITNLANDIALKLAAPDVRIEAPIPGKSLIGIEVPNTKTETITLRNIIEGTPFFDQESKLISAVGMTISGEAILMDLGKMPHVLIAGATGSGKSICLNTIIISILMRATPDEVKMLMIDPKKVELSLYEDIPHLIAPVVTDPHKAAATLKRWALTEMENRYETFSRVGVKNIEGFNQKIESCIELGKTDEEAAREKLNTFLYPDGDIGDVNFEPKKLPYIVVIIDELADLMMVASQEVETTICRLAQMARATGIHLVIATQRPSVNVITGLIKANIPSRISFYLQSQIDSRTVLDMGGAEKLLGKGDMLYSPVGSFKPQRIQGVFVSEKEIKSIVSFVKEQAQPQYLDELIDIEPLESSSSNNKETGADVDDDLLEEAKRIIMTTQYASTSYLQRKLRIGYNRAARLMDELREQGVIAQYANQKGPRNE